MSLSKYLENWNKTHPVYDPAQDHGNVQQQTKVLTWLKDGGESPLPTWPKLKGKKQ